MMKDAPEKSNSRDYFLDGRRKKVIASEVMCKRVYLE
jgi:hypothetical protein